MQARETDSAGDAGKGVRRTHQFIARRPRLGGHQRKLVAHGRQMNRRFLDKDVVQALADPDTADHHALVERRLLDMLFAEREIDHQRRRSGLGGKSQRFAGTHARGRRDQGLAIGAGSTGVRQVGHPARKQRMRGADQGEQVGAGRARVLKPLVHGLLDRPGGIAEARQPDHPAASLEGMKPAPDRSQQVLAGGFGFDLGMQTQNVAEHFVRLFEKDRQQFGIDHLVGRARQRLHLFRGRRGGFLPLFRRDLRHGLFEVIDRGRADRRLLQQFEHAGRGLLESRLVDQVRILFDRGDVGLEFGRQHGVAGLVAPGFEQGSRVALLLRQVVLDGEVFRGARRPRARRRKLLRRHVFDGCRRRMPGHDGPHQRVEIGRTMLQGFNEEPEPAHGLRDLLEIALHRHILRIGEARDFRLADSQRRHRTVGAQDRQRAQHLAHLAVQRRQVAAPPGVAKKAVQRGLDGRQVALDLDHHLRHQQALLRAARHFIEQRNRSHVGGLARETGLQARPHGHHLLRKLGREMREVLGCVFGQQQGGRGFERDRFGDLAGVFGDPHGHRRDRVDQQRQIVVAERGHPVAQLRGLVAEARQLMRMARRKTVPLVPCDRENLAHGAQVGLLRPGVPLGRFFGRQRVVERVQAADFQQVRALHPASSDEIQGIAQQALGNVLRAFHQALHLQVDARAQALRIKAAARAQCDQGLDETDGDPPERPVLRQRLGTLDRAHRLGHFAQGGVVGLIAQPAQQTGLKATALAQHIGAQVGGQVLDRALGRSNG